MGNIFKEDFRDFIQQLNNHDVRYILVGGYSVILHGYTRTTGDMDIWVDRTKENYKKLGHAFFEFGIHSWDVAAACCIVVEAGGSVSLSFLYFFSLFN